MTQKSPRKRTGEKRDANQPLKIDRLPSVVHDAILHLRNGLGKTWLEIEALSAEPYNDGKGPGFIHWEDLPTSVLELFPDMRLPHTTLHRWHDLRVAQVSREVMLRSKQAETIAKAFAKSTVADGDEAVINAARNVLMGVLSEDATMSGRLNATKGLLKLSEVMSKAKTNEIRERRVQVDEQALQIKLDEIKNKAEKLIADVEGGAPGAVVPLTREQLLERVRGIYGIA